MPRAVRRNPRKRPQRIPRTIPIPWALVKLAAGCAVLLGLVLAVFLDRAQDPLLASATPIAPIRAVLAAPWGAGLPDNAWAPTPRLRFRVTLAGNAIVRTVVPEFELLPAGIAFTGVPNLAGDRITLAPHHRAVMALPVGPLSPNRRYHWRVRARSLDGTTSPWVGGSVFGVSVAPPSTPVLSSANAPATAPTNLRTISLHWDASTDPAGIAFYQWATSRDALATPTWHRTDSQALHLSDLGDGTWYISVRAVNHAGIPSAPLRYAVQIDRQAARVEGITAAPQTVSAATAPIHFRFALSGTATTVLTLAGSGGASAVAHITLGVLPAGEQDVTWDGTDGKGGFLPSGSYTASVSTVDIQGNAGRAMLGQPLTLDARRIVVSLTRQEMTVYDGPTILRHTLITSGGPETQTPVGTFQVIASYSPYIMRSPWPKASRLWYPDSPVSYAILFKDGGYFLHDAPWRGVYGPGSNAVDGIPGGNTTGTHGCVNVPLADEAWLFHWATPGTVVQILP
jgi:hypothetical protein